MRVSNVTLIWNMNKIYASRNGWHARALRVFTVWTKLVLIDAKKMIQLRIDWNPWPHKFRSSLPVKSSSDFSSISHFVPSQTSAYFPFPVAERFLFPITHMKSVAGRARIPIRHVLLDSVERKHSNVGRAWPEASKMFERIFGRFAIRRVRTVDYRLHAQCR